MNVNAYSLYQHYNIPVPSLVVSGKQLDEAFKQMTASGNISGYYIGNLRDYLLCNKVSIQDFILHDQYNKFMEVSNIAEGHHARDSYRAMFYLLCHKYKLIPLSTELCIVPDVCDVCDKYDIGALERGLNESYLGILPYSVLCDYMKTAITANYQIPIVMMSQIKRFLKYYRNYNVSKNGIETDTTTLIFIGKILTKFIRDLGISSFQELDGLDGAYKLKEYMEKERMREANGKLIKYRYKADSRVLACMRIFMNIMWKDLGMKENPFQSVDPLDPSPIEGRAKILETLRLPKDRSDCYGRKTIRKQVYIRIPTKDNTDTLIAPLFNDEEMAKIMQYIRTRRDSIVNGFEPNWENMDLRHLILYHDIIQGDLILAFGILNGPRPLDYACSNVEPIGEFSTDLNDPINRRFFNSIPTIEIPIKENPYKIRPEKRFFGPIFVIFAHLMRVRNRISEMKGIKVAIGKNSCMNEEGTPLFVTKDLSRVSCVTVTKQLRRTLLRVGIEQNKANRSTLYFCRKSFIVYARKAGMPIELISTISGTSPKTLYQHYVYLNMLSDANKQYADRFLAQYGFEIPASAPEPENCLIKEDSNKVAFNTFKSLDIHAYGSLSSQDLCTIDDALETLNKADLRFTRYLLFMAVKSNHMRGIKNSNRWRFSKRSIERFVDKYIDAHGIIALYRKRGCGKISKRRALQILTGDLKNFSIKVTNKYFIERRAVSDYLDNK